MDQPGLKCKMPEHGTKIAMGNRMIHPLAGDDKSAKAERVSKECIVTTTTTPSTPIIYGVRSPA